MEFPVIYLVGMVKECCNLWRPFGIKMSGEGFILLIFCVYRKKFEGSKR